MKKKCLYLTLLISLNSLLLYGCTDRDTRVMELIPIEDISNTSGVDDGNKLGFIETNWKPTKHETLSDIPEVTLELKEDSASSLGATLVFENTSNKQIGFGERYILEQRVDNNWYEVPTTNNSNFSDICHDLPYRQARDLDIDWEFLYGELLEGNYRIIKDVIDFSGLGNQCKDYIACEFDIY